MQVALVRNMSPGPTVFADDGPPKVQIEWQGAGDPNLGDLQEVPEALVSNISFRRVVSRGILKVEDASAEALEQLSGQGKKWAAVQDAQSKTALANLDQQAKNDIVGFPCVGPDSRGTGQCNDSVAIRETELANRPPLCTNHAHLASQYIYAETDRLVNGKPVGTWTRGSVGAALPDQSQS